jgi:regulator of RNase E activity RraA
VTPGDIVLADSGGVLVLPPDPQEVDYCIERALSMQAGEPAMLRDIRAGGRIGDISGANQRLDALLAAQDEEFAKWRR